MGGGESRIEGGGINDDIPAVPLVLSVSYIPEKQKDLQDS